MGDKGESTLRLAMENSANGGDVHCWAEGGDATEDMFVVPDRYAQEADRLIAKRMREIQEMAARRLGDNGLSKGVDMADNDKPPENDFGGTGVGWPADVGIQSEGPSQFAEAAPMPVDEPGSMWDFDPDGNPVLDEMVGGLGDDVPPVLAAPPSDIDPELDDIGDIGLNPVFFGN